MAIFNEHSCKSIIVENLNFRKFCYLCLNWVRYILLDLKYFENPLYIFRNIPI